MKVPDNLLCLFNAELEEKDGRYVIEVPAREVSDGDLQVNTIYRTAVLQKKAPKRKEQGQDQDHHTPAHTENGPPVEKGDQRTVEIEDVGDQGDGITRVERGYVIIVPDAEPGDQVLIEITNVRENVAFGEVLDQTAQ